ncbi:MAG: hypothetical protein ACLGIO_09925 [Acidimicrobiia bacterium]
MAHAPGAVVLRFSEPFNRRLKTIEVTGPDGRAADAGPTLAVEHDPRAMRRKLGLLPRRRSWLKGPPRRWYDCDG